MEIDLREAGSDLSALSARLRSQVCIVGGGIAGLILAHRLMLGGVTVTLLEAGGRRPAAADGSDPFPAELCGVRHKGTGEGRVRALGGCSWTWGGQLLPLPEDAFWPVSAEEIGRHGRNWGLHGDAAAFLAANRVDVPELWGGLTGMKARVSRFTPFARRNLAETLGKRVSASAQVQVVLHAAVVALGMCAEGRRVAWAAVNVRPGEMLRVEAEAFAVAAGAVESCRLLLASQSVAPEGIGNAYGQVGRNFHDHLTVSAAVYTGEARARMLAELGPRVIAPRRQRRAVYSVKLEASPELRAELGIRPAMAHLTVEEPEGSGIDRLRALLRARQSGDFSGLVRGLMARAPELGWEALRMAWYARVKRRRYVSPQATVRLQLNVAQDAPSASRVLLSGASDRNGMPRAVVDWRISAGELASLRRLAGYLRERLEAAGIADGVTWEPALFAAGGESDGELMDRLDDARHAMGGACMGEDPRTSVVDPDLRVHGVENLYVASPAVFPDGSPQLPTLTLSALCVRLAERLVTEFAEGRKGAQLHS